MEAKARKNRRPSTITVNMFSRLTFGHHSASIKVRVTRIWETMSYRASDEPATYFILLDEEDNHFLAIAAGGHSSRILSQLCESFVYYITNFKIVVAPTTKKPVNTGRAILLGTQTSIKDCRDRGMIGRFKFERCLLSEIASHFGNPHNLIDVIGIVVSVGSIAYNVHHIKKLNICLVDESGSLVAITLWGIKTTAFEIDFTNHRHRNVVLAVTGLLVKSKSGKFYLSSTTATKTYFNPKYKQVESLGNLIASTYGVFICRVPSTPYFGYVHPTEDQPRYFTLRQLKKNRTSVPQKRIFCTATITAVLSSENFYFNPCISCSTILQFQKQQYFCANCKARLATLTKSPKISILANDSSGTAEFLVQPHALEQLTGLSMPRLMTACENLRANHGIHLPSVVKSIRGTMCSFELECSPTNVSGAHSQLVIRSIIQSSLIVAKRKAVGSLLRCEWKKQCRTLQQ